MKWALLSITVGVLCLIGWASLLVFSVLRLTGVLEVPPETEGAITLILLPFALGFPASAEMIERGARGLAPGAIVVRGAALIWVLTLPLLDHLRDWVEGVVDRLIEKGTTP